MSDYQNNIKASLEFDIQFTEEENGMYSCFVPDMNLYYSTNTAEEIQTRGSAMIRFFIKFYNDMNQEGKIQIKNTDPIL